MKDCNPTTHPLKHTCVCMRVCVRVFVCVCLWVCVELVTSPMGVRCILISCCVLVEWHRNTTKRNLVIIISVGSEAKSLPFHLCFFYLFIYLFFISTLCSCCTFFEIEKSMHSLCRRVIFINLYTYETHLWGKWLCMITILFPFFMPFFFTKRI